MMEIENSVPVSNDYRPNRGRTSLLRGLSVQESPDLLIPALSCRRRSIEHVLGATRPVPATSSREIFPDTSGDQELEVDFVENVDEPFVTQSRRATISSGVGLFYSKRPSNLRDWPFGEPKLRNDGEYLELDFSVGPFKPEEISTKIVGKDLIIHCKSNEELRLMKDEKPKEIFRCYQLPLTANPTPSDVSIVKDEQYIRLAIRKEAPLKSPISLLFAPEISNILEEDQQSEPESPETGGGGPTNEMD